MFEINWKWIGSLLLLVLVLSLAIGMVLSAGCITAGKKAYHQITDTPIPTPIPTIPPPPTPIPTPIPTQDPEVLMLETGGHYLGEWISIKRDNVSGLQDLSLYSTVYGYRFEKNYRWWSVQWADYLTEVPPPGMKYLFIFANSYTDGDDVRPWGIDEDHFRVQVQDTMYPPSGIYDKTVRIKELENTSNLAGTSWLSPYGLLRVASRSQGEHMEEWGYIKGGYSNAWDGYICFLVPDWTEPDQVAVRVRYDGLANNHWWTLYKKGEGHYTHR